MSKTAFDIPFSKTLISDSGLMCALLKPSDIPLPKGLSKHYKKI